MAGTKDEVTEVAPCNCTKNPNVCTGHTDFVCRDDPVYSNPSSYIELTAGSSFNVTWDLTAAHPGDCFVYMSYDADLPASQMQWFKIAEWNECETGKINIPQTVDVPSYLPSSSHIVVRWEWYALHQQNPPTNAIEFYSQCFDAVITGDPSGALPDPKVNIPGHLPTNASLYRDPYNPNGAKFFTGPPIATIGGGTYTVATTDPTTNTIPPTPTPPATPVATTGYQAATPSAPPTIVPTAPVTSGSMVSANSSDNATPCQVDSDCSSGLCQIDHYCYTSKSSSSGLGAGGIAAIVFAGLVLVVIVVGGVFFYANRKEVPYMTPFRGRV